MLVCGINDGHNASAAIVKDGVLLCALQEERLRRIKNWQGFPVLSIKALLASIGASVEDVDAFVYAGQEAYLPLSVDPGDRDTQIRAYGKACSAQGTVRRLLRHTAARSIVQRRRGNRRIEYLTRLGVPVARIHTVEHHQCHAAAAYYGRGAADDVLVITLDGAGDGLCATVSLPNRSRELCRVGQVGEEHSIGILWSVVTSLLGMVPLEHEYKLMGMAPYGSGGRASEVAAKFARAFQAENGNWRRSAGMPEAFYSFEYWKKHLSFDRFDHICAGLQSFTEAFVTNWIRGWLQKTGKRHLYLSGGVFLNVKLNKAIGELAEVDDLYVFPSCGDETNAIGAAWGYLASHGAATMIKPLGPLYLGVDPTRRIYERASQVARERGYCVEQSPNLTDRIARLIANGDVVAHFQGREEFGARALGNRSILADPGRPEIVRVINKAIKCRDFWMPFACSILSESEGRYLSNPKRFHAPYMILSFDSQRTQEIVAGCHPEDGTVRPQVVDQESNPAYHSLIKRFGELTGRAAVLNTSFNIHGEPIVSTPEQAINVLNRSGLQYLALGNYLIYKPVERTSSDLRETEMLHARR
jgi:carbamoyltransferase